MDELHHRTARYSDRRNTDIEAYNGVLVDIATEHRIAVDDLWAAMRNCRSNAISDDGAHLIDAGSAYLARHIGQQLRRAL